MNAWLESLRSVPVLTRAAALAAVGMSGVFATLFLFFLLILVLERISRKKP